MGITKAIPCTHQCNPLARFDLHNLRRMERTIEMAHNGIFATWEGGCQQPRGVASCGNDLTSPEKLHRQLRESEMARMELSRRLINAQEADRTRLSRELHDDIGQSLSILKVRMLQCVRSAFDHPERAPSDLEELAESLDAVIDKVSRFSHDLHSSSLEFLGLAAAVHRHCMECSQRLGFPIRCHCQGSEEDLDNTVALAFFRIVQEGIQNAIKHSRATNMLVRIIRMKRLLSLEISDDGIGFDIKAQKNGKGLGLISMRERAFLIGGRCRVISSPAAARVSSYACRWLQQSRHSSPRSVSADRSMFAPLV